MLRDPHQNLQIWRPAEIDQKLHTAKNFNIKSGLPDAFKRDFPYNFPHLKTDEEFIAIRAKPRPVVLIQPPDAALANINTSSGGMNIKRLLCVVAPVFSLVDEVGYRKVPEEFQNNVRLLQYTQFLFLPMGGAITRDSILRFDELQSVAVTNLKYSPFQLAGEVIDLMKSQIGFYLSGTGGDFFLDYRELLNSE